VLGGTQSLHTNARDEALSLPTEESVQIALRTQQIIAYESGVADTIDPLAGSYFVEHLTDEIERRSRTYIEKIDDMGGALVAIERGYMQREIQESAYRFQKAVEQSDEVIVGVNRFTISQEQSHELLRVDLAVGQRQAERLSALRAHRDSAQVQAALADLRRAARRAENLLPPILAAVKAHATLGEICGLLRKELGEYQPHDL